MQADPLGLVDGVSVYGYARQNPGRYVDPTGEFIVPVAIGAIVGAGVGYYETGCWQGAVAGGAVGALAGVAGGGFSALGANSLAAGAGTGAGASALSQIINNELADLCGCGGERRPVYDLITDPQFAITTLVGSAGGMYGAFAGGESSVLTHWAGAHIGKTIIKDVIAELTSTGTGIFDGSSSATSELSQ